MTDDITTTRLRILREFGVKRAAFAGPAGALSEVEFFADAPSEQPEEIGATTIPADAGADPSAFEQHEQALAQIHDRRFRRKGAA